MKMGLIAFGVAGFLVVGGLFVVLIAANAKSVSTDPKYIGRVERKTVAVDYGKGISRTDAEYFADGVEVVDWSLIAISKRDKSIEKPKFRVFKLTYEKGVYCIGIPGLEEYNNNSYTHAKLRELSNSVSTKDKRFDYYLLDSYGDRLPKPNR